ncbi:LOW QUALITY PROTEIN: hypothetical protein SETIT_7G159900v2 [Setaria italica]|uniref:Uncharacterized protein n=1 Tax=Setaria italica TaxID=4555 RepID=A0A368RW68_SETIT|nr:LOW QUALITY PROTEIN: hypothetical protein SETIT_7G159900v2 [Setaria italica]
MIPIIRFHGGRPINHKSLWRGMSERCPNSSPAGSCLPLLRPALCERRNMHARAWARERARHAATALGLRLGTTATARRPVRALLVLVTVRRGIIASRWLPLLPIIGLVALLDWDKATKQGEKSKYFDNAGRFASEGRARTDRRELLQRRHVTARNLHCAHRCPLQRLAQRVLLSSRRLGVPAACGGAGSPGRVGKPGRLPVRLAPGRSTPRDAMQRAKRAAL